MIKKYKNIFEEVEAIQYCEEDKIEIFKFVYPDASHIAVDGFMSMNLPLIIETIDGDKIVSENQYIVKFPTGEIKIYGPREFEKKYWES